MSASSPGRLRRGFRAFWWFLDATRRAFFTLLFWLVLGIIVFAMFHSGAAVLADKTALVLNLEGVISEQKAGTLRSSAIEQLSGSEGARNTQLRDVLSVVEAATVDPKVARIVVILDEMQGTGLASLHEIGAALDRFKAAGKQVVAWGSSYDQRQYYIASRADEVYLHPFGSVLLEGFGRHRNYYKDALDKLGVNVNLIRVGTYKSAAEPYIANGPSPAAAEADTVLYNDLWSSYLSSVEQARKLAPGTIMKGIDEAPEQLAAVNGDMARLALKFKLVDGLKTKDELRTMMIERGARDDEGKTFRQVSFDAYLARQKPKLFGDAVGVVVAEGEIVEGTAPAGAIGGVSTAALIRRARENDAIKAIVLRVNSPGGSVFASELVRRELELARAGGKPVVVSMGDLAASGGYWISTASDEVIADPGTITGSIGVFALLPTVDKTLDKIGVHTEGVTTTWLRDAGDPRLPLDPRFAALLQTTVNHTYADFIGRVAAARKTTPEKIDAIGQGRVWTGAQAKERGLVDRLGGFDDALQSAAGRAKLAKGYRVAYIEREPGKWARVLNMLNGTIGAAMGDRLNLVASAAGLTPQVAREMTRELGWVADIADRRKPFSAVAHCFCAAP